MLYIPDVDVLVVASYQIISCLVIFRFHVFPVYRVKLLGERVVLSGLQFDKLYELLTRIIGILVLLFATLHRVIEYLVRHLEE